MDNLTNEGKPDPSNQTIIWLQQHYPGNSSPSSVQLGGSHPTSDDGSGEHSGQPVTQQPSPLGSVASGDSSCGEAGGVPLQQGGGYGTFPLQQSGCECVVTQQPGPVSSSVSSVTSLSGVSTTGCCSCCSPCCRSCYRSNNCCSPCCSPCCRSCCRSNNCCSCCSYSSCTSSEESVPLLGDGMTRNNSETSSTNLLPKYNHRNQISSLSSLQSLLLGSSDQVVSNLKSLVFKAYNSTTEDTFSSHVVGFQPKRRLRAIQGLSKTSYGTLHELKRIQPKVSYRVFGFMDNYESNLERKGRSGRVGVSLSLMPKVQGTLAYNCSKQEFKQHGGLNFKQSAGSVKIRSATEGVSTAIIINGYEAGFTGHVASSYTWGTVKTNRSVLHGKALVRTKGSPESTLSGNLVQIGYNIPVASEHMLTPYIENVISRVTWKGYDEKSKFLPCSISKSREQVIEKSIGLRHQWNVKQEQQLQTWVAHVMGQRHVSGLTSRPLMNRDSLYDISIPHYKHRYSGTEIGFVYQVAYTEDCTIGFNGAMRLQNTKKTDKQMYSCSMQYIF